MCRGARVTETVLCLCNAASSQIVGALSNETWAPNRTLKKGTAMMKAIYRRGWTFTLRNHPICTVTVIKHSFGSQQKWLSYHVCGVFWLCVIVGVGVAEEKNKITKVSGIGIHHCTKTDYHFGGGVSTEPLSWTPLKGLN